MKITPYKTNVRGEQKWVISYTDSSTKKRKRQFFDTKVEAFAEAKAMDIKYESSGQYWATMSASDRAEAALIIEEIMEAGYTLRQVWYGWKNKEGITSVIPKKVIDAVKECIASKVISNRRARYIEGLSYGLMAFAKGREDDQIRTITTSDIEDHLQQYKNPSSRQTWLSWLSTLFGFAMRKEWITKNPCDKIEHINIETKRPVILTPEQTAQIMEWLVEHPSALAWFTLATFAGIRPEECDKVTWDQVYLDRGIVEMDSDMTKIRTRRIIHLEPNAIAWLKLAKYLKSELPITRTIRRIRIRKVRDFMGWKVWPKDILRKSAASYLMAKYQDAGKVADELGNSAGVLLKHYRELVDKSKAEEFFGIMPKISV